MTPRMLHLTALLLSAGTMGVAAMDQSAAPEQGEQVIPPEVLARLAQGAAAATGDLQPFAEVSKDYTKVVSTADGAASLWTIYTRPKDAQALAELPQNFDQQQLFVAFTIAGGIATAGVQYGDMYVQWRKYDKRLALIQPNLAVRTSGDLESKKGRDRVFTDRVVLDVPILSTGPGGGPVIDLDSLLVGQASKFFGYITAGANTALVKIEKAKAFPKNIEMAFELPLQSGQIASLHYSISQIPENTGYQPRVADARVGYFTTTHMDVGKPGADTPWVRYINRWKLEKADPSLKLSPPKEPIVFYLEHTTPVRYRRWVRDGVLEWNRAYEKVGILNAVEVYQQDARTGAHMDKDPEDARYNFVLWTNANMGFAIGPSRVHPETGQILDADIVMDEGFITSWVSAWKTVIPQVAMEGLGPETLEWLGTRPQYDPRVRLAPLSQRENILRELAMQRATRGVHRFGGHPAAAADPTLMGDQPFDGLAGRVSQMNGACLQALSKSLDIALFRMSPELFLDLAGREGEAGGKAGDGDTLDGVPDWFIGPLLKDVVMHEVGHTLGLRHNFKASSIHSVQEINTESFKGRAQTASVMDYNPININFGDGPVQGDYTMVTVGPYDLWAIEYGYSLETDLKPILAKVSERDRPYATDEDTWGPDPLARRFDYGADPLDYAASQMRLVTDFRTKIIEKAVKEGESWEKAREAYEILLGRHLGAVAIAANWLGGAHVNRDRKGDPGARDPIAVVPMEKQRRALRFVIDHTFKDSAFGLTPDLLAKMTLDKWWDEGGFWAIFEDPTWPVHDRIMGIQATAMTMLINPTRLRRVYDNEFRIAPDGDAITLPELINTVTDAAWSELEESPGMKYTDRKPMISSLRRNLQREHLDRMIDLTLPNAALGTAAKPISTLACWKLRQLSDKIGRLREKNGAAIDAYSVAHLDEAKVRIDKALDASYIYNLDSINVNLNMPAFMFGEPKSAPPGSTGPN